MSVDPKVLDFRAHGARRFEGKVCVVAQPIRSDFTSSGQNYSVRDK